MYIQNGYDQAPIVLVGQDHTYNSGGINLKTPDELNHQRGDMCACVVATCRAMRLPINVRGLVPLCEHMIGCNSIKPGSVVQSKSGKSNEIERTDEAGVLTLNDALLYAQTFNPQFVVSVSTILPGAEEAVGPACSVAFTNTEALWEKIRNAGGHTGDRVWRMPLWDFYRKQVSTSPCVDLQNVCVAKGGGACRAAAFSNEFVDNNQWMHIDARGVMRTEGTDWPYLKYGMAGRPTRTLIEFIAQTVCKEEQAQTATMR